MSERDETASPQQREQQNRERNRRRNAGFDANEWAAGGTMPFDADQTMRLPEGDPDATWPTRRA